METRTARQILNALATRVIADNRDLWAELKEEFADYGNPNVYGSVIGLNFQYAAKKAMAALDDPEPSVLTQHAEQVLPRNEKDRCPSRLVVAEIMSRAKRVVTRRGGDAW